MRILYIKLRQDSRDAHAYMKFGQVMAFQQEVNFDTPLADEIQPVGDVRCTCYTTCNIAEDQFKTFYDIDNLWSRIPQSALGADPRDVLGEAVKNGLLTKDGKIVKNWSSYWRADSGNLDAFDNVRSIMSLIKCPVGVATYWYANWPSGETLPIGQNPTSGHMWEIEGWKEVNGQPHFIVEAWIGRKLLMSREVFNMAMKPYGMSAWVLSTSDRDVNRVKTLQETIKDLLQNALAIARQLLQVLMKKQTELPVVPTPIATVVVPEVVIPKRDLLTEFCTAIRDYEGKPGDLNYRNNNPGNLRSVKGPFLKFKTYDEGFNALKDYVTRACTGKHPAYKPDFTIVQYFHVYSPSADNNNPDKYAEWVCAKLRILTSTKIKDLL